MGKMVLLLSMENQAQAHQVIVYSFNIYCYPTVHWHYGRHVKYKDKRGNVCALNLLSWMEDTDM